MAIKCPKCQFENPDDTSYCGKCAAPLVAPDEVLGSLTKIIDAAGRDLSKGTAIAGKYRIMEKLGAGGMGEVYRAEDLSLNRQVAIKVLPSVFAADSERLARFKREAKILASLNHPNIAAIYGVEQADTNRFLVLELVEGENLAERLSRGAFSLEETLDVCRQIAEGLEGAHEKNIIHRDLKPSNIKITPDGKVKILDFGLARAFHDQVSDIDLAKSPTITADMTQPGVILGTAAYMSPEQTTGRPVDKRADIWAFGCILFECLTGKRAFPGDTVTETLAAILKGEPDWQVLPAATSLRISDLLRRCLQKDTRERLHDIADARIDIEAVLAGPFKGEAAVKRLPHKRRALLQAVALAILGILLGAIGAVLLLGPRKEMGPLPLRKYHVAVGASEQASLALTGAAVSPDGRRVAYTLRDGVWVQDLDKLEPKRIHDTEAAARPFWSPDSIFIGFFDLLTHTLKRIPAEGGEAQTLCQVPGTDIGGAFWGSEGSIFFCWGGGWGTRAGGGLYQVPEAGGTSVLLAKAGEGEIGFMSPLVLPRNAGVLVVVQYYDEKWKVVRISQGELREPVLDIPGSAQIAYSPSGHLLYSLGTGGLWAVPIRLSPLKITEKPVRIAEAASTPSISSDGTLVYAPKLLAAQRLVWVNRRGEVTGMIGQPQEFMAYPKISPDGSRVAVHGTEVGKTDIWIQDIAQGTKTRLTFDGTNIQPAWTSDGHEIVYSSKEADGRLMAKPADGIGKARPLIDELPGQYDADFSKEGRFMVFVTVDANKRLFRDLWYKDLLNGGAPTSFVESPFDEFGPAFSVDSRYVAYVSNETGIYEVYVRPFPNGAGKWKISDNGGVQPRWGRSGKTLYYVQGNSLMAVTVDTRSDFKRGRAEELFRGDAISVQLSFLTSPYNHFYDVAPDEQSFAVVQSVRSREAGLVVIENWVLRQGR